MCVSECDDVLQQTSGQQKLMFIFIYLYNVYQTKTDTASNLKRIKREKKREKKKELKTEQSVGLWISRC